MGAEVGPPRRFLKVLMPGFTEKLELPIDFVRNVLGEKRWNSVRIRSSLGKLWEIKMHSESNCTCFCGTEWLHFVEAHELQVGYFLIFDHDGDIDFDVTVYDRSSCRKTYRAYADDETDIEDQNFTSELSDAFNSSSASDSHAAPENIKVPLRVHGKTYFHSVIGPHHLKRKGYLNVPRGFLALYDFKGISIVVLSNSKGQWHVRLGHSSSHNRVYVRFGHGWRTFASENKLVEGDVCTFKLLSKESNHIIHFGVIKQHQWPREHTEGTHIEDSSVPYFELKMKHHNVSDKAYLRIPRWFMGLRYLSSHCGVFLIDPNGKSWPVSVIHSYNNEKLQSRLCAGWKDFSRGNELMIGDLCTFKLVIKGLRVEINVEVLKCRTSKRIDDYPIIVENNTSLKVTGESIVTDITEVKDIVPAVDDACFGEKNIDKIMQKLDDGNNRTVVGIEGSILSDESDRRIPVYSSRDSVQKGCFQREQQCRPKVSPWGQSDRGPKFAVTLKPYHVAKKGYLKIPKSFEGLKYLHGKQNIVLMDQKERAWLVKLYDNQCRFGAGWHRVCRESRLSGGDECTFELLWVGSDIVMQFKVQEKVEVVKALL